MKRIIALALALGTASCTKYSDEVYRTDHYRGYVTINGSTCGEMYYWSEKGLMHPTTLIVFEIDTNGGVFFELGGYVNSSEVTHLDPSSPVSSRITFGFRDDATLHEMTHSRFKNGRNKVKLTKKDGAVIEIRFF